MWGKLRQDSWSIFSEFEKTSDNNQEKKTYLMAFFTFTFFFMNFNCDKLENKALVCP